MSNISPIIIDISEQKEYEKAKATLRLMCELEKGKHSGEEKVWVSSDDVRKHFKRTAFLKKYRPCLSLIKKYHKFT